jgi:hypothetical protein
MDSGLFGPTWDDVFRIAILVVGVLNVAVILVGILALRHYARLLLDVEQFTREVRNFARESGAATESRAGVGAPRDEP